ncbi:luciferin 4-monooxygenase-like [Diabrotica undecimpunctata]|uniref:luciferin 4-monooxygenase-like n=1 Tax=Diabrotica undecimpunctata TaxID=50387 RepID=UPI003B637ACD
MVAEENSFVLYGPETDISIPDGLLGNFMYNSLLNTNVKHFCMVDVFSGETRTYRSLVEDSCTLAQALLNFGLQPNTIVSISSENNVRFFDAVLASLYVGATVAPINHVYTEDELRHVLTLYRPEIIFCSNTTIKKFWNLQKEFSFIKKLIIIYGDEAFGVENIQSFKTRFLGSDIIRPELFKPYDEEDPVHHLAFILSSSGTTGLPKGVMLTDRNFLVRIAQSRHEDFSVGPLHGHTTLALMPLFHGFGLNIMINGLANKEQLAVMKHFDEDIFLKTVQDYKISTLLIAPPLAVFLAKSPKVNKYDLRSVKEIIIGAAPLSKETESALHNRLRNLNSARQAYGLTEATLAVTAGRRFDKVKPGCSGYVITYMAIAIKDPESGKSLGPHQVGEVCIKGPLVMKGYFRNPEATRQTFTSDGWLKSGDLGYYDEEKYIFIVDRLKELIKYKGFQVAPAELEAVILNHPKVLDVGVVGAPDELAGELPLAFVVKRPGVDLTEKELQTFVSKKVSPQKRLRGGIIFIDAIPKNPSGKILRRELRKLVPKHTVHRESKL